jgi:hypothetical protein
MYGRRRRGGGDGRRIRARGCLLWVLLVIVVLIILSLMFGGFQKGTKSGGLGQHQGLGSPASSCTTCTSVPFRTGVALGE